MVIIKNCNVKKLFNKFSEIFGKIGINFLKFSEIFRGKFPEISELTTLNVIVVLWTATHRRLIGHKEIDLDMKVTKEE